MKSYENINILKIEVKIFCMKNDFFLQKSFYLKQKKLLLEAKTFYL